MNELLDNLFEWIHIHPEYNYLIVSGLLLFWLFGVIRGWKWTYEINTWTENTLRNILGEKGCRFCVGVLLVIALTVALYLFFSTTGDIDMKEDKTEYCHIQETFRYCFEGNGITATDTVATSKCSGTHRYIIKPFFNDMARSFGVRPETADVSEYCNLHRYISFSDSLPGDTARQTFQVTLDILSFGKCNEAFRKCLNSLRGKDFTAVNVISKALVRCLVLWKDEKLFVLWCNFFDDSERITNSVRKHGLLQ